MDIAMSTEIRKSDKILNKKDKSQISKCSFCNKRNHTEERCFLKHPELSPKQVSSINKTEISNRDSSEDIGV